MEDCYKILGVKPNASIAEIRRAYREKVKKYHPDVSGDESTAEHFKKIVRAYEILTDQKSRAIFDSSFSEHFRRRKVKSWDYREWLLSRDDDESRAKLIFFDLLHGREDDAVAEFKRMQTERSRFSLKHWFTRENFDRSVFMRLNSFTASSSRPRVRSKKISLARLSSSSRAKSHSR